MAIHVILRGSIAVLVTCKIDDDLIKSEVAFVLAFSQ